MATVVVACAAQGGLIVGTDAWNNPIKLNGPPAPASGLNVGYGNAGFGFSTIDESLWDTWSAGPGAHLVASGACWKVS